MSLTTDLPQYALTQSSLTSIIGQNFFPVTNDPDYAFPSVVFAIISNVPVETHDGSAHLTFARVQFSCFAENYATARSIRDALKALFESFVGTIGATVVQNVRYLTEHDTYESGNRIYSTVLEMEFAYTE